MKILFINNFKNVDYLNDTTFHGAKSLYGDDVIESSNPWYLYDDVKPDDLKNNWGLGFTVGGKLKRTGNVDNSNLEEKIKDNYFDLIIYGSVHRDLSHWDLVKQFYPKNKIVLIDGEDELDVRNDILQHGTYFKRELQQNSSDLIPISFSIPKELIVEKQIDFYKTKFHFLSRLTAGLTGYKYANEKEYFNEYQQSCYSLTKKKAGWDCMRHYEIAANGCLPVFYDLDKMPSQTMIHWNRELLKECYHAFWNWKLDSNYLILRNKMLQHVHDDLTTESMFKYILNKL